VSGHWPELIAVNSAWFSQGELRHCDGV